VGGFDDRRRAAFEVKRDARQQWTFLAFAAPSAFSERPHHRANFHIAKIECCYMKCANVAAQ
jgi:hypothetical protein